MTSRTCLGSSSMPAPSAGQRRLVNWHRFSVFLKEPPRTPTMCMLEHDFLIRAFL